MKDNEKTKEQLVNELVEMRQRISGLQALEIEHKRVENELRKGREFLEKVIDTARDGIMITDEKGQITYVNTALAELSGRSKEELIGEHTSVLAPKDEEYREMFRGKLAKLFKCGSVSYETYFVPSGGESIDVEWNTSMVEDKDGNYIAAVSIMRDITERKKSENDIEESRDFFENVIKVSVDGIMIVDPGGNIVRTNKALQKMVGYTQEELIGKHASELNIKEEKYRKISTDMVARLFEKGSVENAENMWMRKDGSLFPIEINMALFKDGEGNYSGGVSIVRDITDRKRTDKEIRLNETRLEALLKLSQMTQSTTDEIAEFALEESARLTKSEVGFINFLSEDEKYVTNAVYTKETLQQCKLPITLSAFEISDCGLWSEAYRQRKPIIVNDYAAEHSSKTDLPDGHLQLKRFMSIPVFEKDRVVAVAALGNKHRDYNQGDVRQFRLFMEGLWQIINRKQAEEALRESEEKYRTVIEANPDPVVVYDMEGKVVYFNPAFTSVFGWT
ncbi:PAS domain S-box protein, partial [Candidatus Pacearchaeota archaeon]|nr:PAS domain S-box protein [Candidatus Pacearchaeota archaeon]